MKVDVKKLDKIKRTMNVEVGGDEFKNKKNEIYKEAAKKLKVSGFRPGTAPMDVVEKQYGSFLKEEFLKQSLPQFYQQALAAEKITPASMPKIYDVDLNNNFLKFSAELEAKPEIEVKENVYKGIKIKDKKIQVGEPEIEKVVTNLKEGVKKTLERDIEEDELARWAAYPDIKSLREAVKAQLFIEKARERKQKIDTQVREHLLKNLKIELPKGEVDMHYNELLKRETYNLRSQGVAQEDIDKYQKELEAKLKPIAQDDVKLFYILEAIAKKENLKTDNKNLGEIALSYIFSQAKY